jgi:hypothetical protein
VDFFDGFLSFPLRFLDIGDLDPILVSDKISPIRQMKEQAHPWPQLAAFN